MSEHKTGLLALLRRGPDVEKTSATTSGVSLFLAGPPAAGAAPVISRPRPVAPGPRPRLVFAVDATSSRAAAWKAAKQLQDSLFEALPGELDVALAVHGGSKLHTFTPFLADPGPLRDRAAGIKCKAGYTKLLPILERVIATEGVNVVIYVGDVYEEDRTKAFRAAKTMRARGTRLIVLHDRSGGDASGQVMPYADFFAELAAETGGGLLPFDHSALPELRELLRAAAVLAVGGTELLAAKQDTMPAATLLLEHLSAPPRLGKR